ncbi:MAG: UDP-N-acetylmuramoyl-L-alanyl-D-glutamate--2,6-diaminopimelate ligase [Ilumatobacter sp.]|uniref:UDP-N-acetylmuramoyl-L-alanyl-D-glutamate--2, 6-diaminopimelate ligase n=1 Tax=Ilumatobacter sp. TaxID=1967498 RepID=UPI003C71082C
MALRTIEAVASRIGVSSAQIIGDASPAVSGMSHDSRTVQPGHVFACLRGSSFDGHDHAAGAVAAGAVALLVDHRLDGVGDVAQIVVADTRRAVGPAAAAAWGDPADRLLMIGITGTNGKTTTAQIVAAALDGAGVSTGIIGTLHGPRTTPEAPELHAALAGFVDEGRSAVVMEVSSHALELRRVHGTRFDVVGFTNFGHDHLDLHGSPEAYFRAKSLLFSPSFSPRAVINVDDTHGRLLADGVDGDIDVRRVGADDLSDVVVGQSNHSYTWNDRRIEVPLGGDFNVANSQMAIELVARLAEAQTNDGDGAENGIDLDAAITGLGMLAPVPGRFELVETPETVERKIAVVVDYAHTPDGLERVLESARRITTGRVIAVFGCAGRRDREKRPVMGEVAGRLADVAVATSDNPRGEDPQAIIDDVIEGVAANYRSRVSAQPDRRVAIRVALQTAESGDTVVIAGKGHETYQDLGDTTIDFDDRAVARDELARHEPKDLS